MAIKERRITCAACGERETVIRGERGPVTAYCDVCRAERQREQARQRMAALRARQRRGSGQPAQGARAWVMAVRLRRTKGPNPLNPVSAAATLCQVVEPAHVGGLTHGRPR